ncbi:glycosyltransferase family 4 protein [Claveliimonas bilis]|uniref:glycosyltransferase family 4 protein n=1 Tax=Claveliimonas bilis TaxID=3028070 RepID=UPI002930D0C1|nr:glycosyltransferase family 4 protein [Claveliimonas bilis]
MKIWVIGRSYPEPGNNMSGSFELEQAKMLQKNGNEVSYLCCSLHPNKKIRRWGYQRWKDDGIKVYSDSERFFPRISPFYFLKRRNCIWSRFFEQVKKEDGIPDIIHVHYPAMLMIADALYPYHKMGVKVVITEHWTKVLSQSLDRTELKAYRKYFEYIDSCVCVGSPLANSVKKLVGDTRTPIHIVPNVVDSEFKPMHSNHEGFEFIAVGRLVKVKQFDQIIRAFSDCFRGKDAHLLIIGGGEEYNSLKSLIIKLSMEKQITLEGSLPRKEVAEKIAKADCLVCYSRFETFGVPIIEAWACGIPTTATTTVAAVIDNFDKRLGVKVHYDNLEELKEKMIYMYENISLFDKKYISEFAQERFSEHAVYKQIDGVYVNCMKHYND